MTVTSSIMSAILQSSTYRFSKTTIEEWRAARSGAGDDQISAYSNATVDGGDGSDYISAYDHATVSGGRGDDVIDTYDHSIIDGGDGNDHISVYDHSKVTAGAGNDWVSGYDHSTVEAGDGNDYISVYGDSTVDGGAGNDVIETYERSVITGGKGADRIQTGGGSILKYAAGDGRDQIRVSGSATLQLGEGISADAVQVTVNGRTATISINGNADDVITVELYSAGSSSLTIAFADGSTRQVTAQPTGGGGTPHLPPNSQVPILLPPEEPAMSKEAFEAMIRDPNMSQAQREYLVGALAPAIYGIPRYDYSRLEWHSLPPGAAQPMSAEVKAELAAREAHAQQLKAEYDAETAAHPERYNPQPESNAMYETNVATLPDDAIKPRIDYITYLIQSGEAEKYSFHSGNGDQTTSSIHQYLYWLQQRARELESDGVYSPGMFG